jgi:tetratricopeptide (TPR) repeat protein
LEKTAPDTNRVKLLIKIADYYFFIRPDTTRIIIEKALTLSRDLHFLRGEVISLTDAAETYRFLGNYPLALKMNFEALQLNREMKDIDGEATSLGFIGFDYVEFREYRQGLEYLLQAVQLNKQMYNQLKETFCLTNIANAYNLLKMPDSGLYYSQLAYKTYTGLKHGPLKSLILTRIGKCICRSRKKRLCIELLPNGFSQFN